MWHFIHGIPAIVHVNIEGGQWLPLGREYGSRGLLTQTHYWKQTTGEDSVSWDGTT
jgi:hypothetical protein